MKLNVKTLKYHSKKGPTLFFGGFMKKIWFILLFLGLSFLPVQAQEPVEITHFNTNIVINENGLMQVDRSESVV